MQLKFKGHKRGKKLLILAILYVSPWRFITSFFCGAFDHLVLLKWKDHNDEERQLLNQEENEPDNVENRVNNLNEARTPGDEQNRPHASSGNGSSRHNITISDKHNFNPRLYKIQVRGEHWSFCMISLTMCISKRSIFYWWRCYVYFQTGLFQRIAPTLEIGSCKALGTRLGLFRGAFWEPLHFLIEI